MCCITSTQYLTTACVSALKPMSYNSHTSQHAEGFGHCTQLRPIQSQVIILALLRFTQLNPLNGKLAVSSTSWKEIVEFVDSIGTFTLLSPKRTPLKFDDITFFQFHRSTVNCRIEGVTNTNQFYVAFSIPQVSTI